MSVNGRMAVITGAAALISVTPLLALTEEWAWIVPAAIGIAIVSGVGYLLRRLRIPGFIIYLAQPIALILWVGALTAGQEAFLGFIPTTSWADRMLDVFNGAVDALQTYSAPVPVGTGITMLLVGGAGLVAWQVDTIAIAFRSAVFAGLPLAACYAVTASVQLGQVDWWWFLLPAIGYLALLVTDRRSHVRSWGRSMTSSPRRSGVPQTDSLVRNGRRVGAVALLAAVGIPSVLPALSQGVLGPGGVGQGGSGDNVIRTEDPLVNLKRNLKQQDDVEAFRYETEGPGGSYIRWATDAKFDGQTWSQSTQEVPNELTDERLPEPPGLSGTTKRETFEYEITFGEAELSWLPAPYAASRVDIDGEWRYDPDTLDIVSSVSGGVEVPDGFSYSVETIEADPTYQQLQNAGPYPSELKDWTKLPDFAGDNIIRTQANDIVGQARSDFEKAIRLQDHFRATGNYEYNTEPVSERSDSPIVDFLEDRSGYCVQFAGTMAVMARMLDIPARVAVGWLPGEVDTDGTTYVVPANNAHAWPELYFDGVGWVAFEPTPNSRGGTFAPDYTQEPPETPGGESSPSPQDSASPPPGEETANPRLPDEGSIGSGGSGSLDDQSQWPRYALGTAGVVALLCAPWAVAQSRRALRWRRSADDPREAAEAGWSDLRDAVRDARLSWDDSATPRMIGHQVAGEAQLADEDLEILQYVVTTTERARYARSANDTEGLKADSANLRRTILRGRSLKVRIRAFLWPAAISDLFVAGRSRGADALDWFDGTTDRLRTAMRLPRA